MRRCRTAHAEDLVADRGTLSNVSVTIAGSVLGGQLEHAYEYDVCRLTSVSRMSPFSRICLTTSSSLCVPNSFSSWLFEAPSRMPVVPCLFGEMSLALVRGVLVG